jgi:hypothetical protein
MRVAIPVILMLAAAAQLQGQTPDSAPRRDTVFAAVPALQQAEPSSALDGLIAGRLAARGQSNAGPFTGGFIAGFFFPVLGNAVAYGVTASSTPGVPIEQQTALQVYPAEYRLAYEEAYRQEAKARRKQASLMGGLLGSGAMLALSLLVIASAVEQGM